MKVTKLTDSHALRAWATGESLAAGVGLLVDEARRCDIEPQVITITPSAEFEQTGEYEIILWGVG